MSESTEDRAEKIRKLEDIIKSLHGGAPPATVKAQLKEIVRKTDSTEIAAMEQQLMAGGMPVEEVRSMCDLHAEVLKEIITEPPAGDFPPGHPIDTFRRENEALHRSVEQIQTVIVQTSSTARIGRVAKDGRAIASRIQRTNGHRQALPAQGKPAVFPAGSARHHRPLEGDVVERRRGAAVAQTRRSDPVQGFA